jgi:O-antigen/teichoic acid export membrane protein
MSLVDVRIKRIAMFRFEAPISVTAADYEPVLKSSTKLTRSASLNIVASLLDYVAKLVVGFFVTPILVAGLGRALFGVWEILGRLVGYMSATDGRPTEALRLTIANQQAIDDPASKRRYIASALGVWLLFLPILLTAGIVLVWLAPTIGKVPAESYASIRLTAGLLVVNFILANLAALPESVLRGTNLGYKRMGLQAGLSVVGGVFTAGAIYAGSGLVGVAGAQVALTLVTGILFWFVVKKFVPWFGMARPTRADLRSLLGLSIWNTTGSLIAKVQLASDVIILGVIASASMVSTYVLTGYAAQAVTGITTLVLGAVTPGLAGLIGGREYEKTSALRNEMMAINWLLVTAIGSIILLWNRSFLHLWVGEQYYAGSWANLLIVLVMAQTTFIRTDAYLIDATLKLRDRVLVSGVAALLSIAFSIILTPSLGIVGLCIGLLVGRLVQTISYPFILNSRLGGAQSIRPRTIARAGLVMALCFLGSAYMGQRLQAESWLAFIACMGGSLGILTLIASVTGLPSESRTLLNKRFRLILTSIA